MSSSAFLRVTPDVAGISGVTVIEEALPGSLFERLARGIRAVGRERFRKNYTTTFWHSLDAEPSNVAEEAARALMEIARPGPDCVGIEWWLGRLRPGQKLRLHFDRDMKLRQRTGEFVHPIFASALYLNAFPDSPTVILDQVPGPDGKGRVPRRAERRAAIEPVPNRYSVFPGNLRHGVVPEREIAEEEVDPGVDLRLSFLVNYWDRRPLAPLCADFDGSVYPALCEV